MYHREVVAYQQGSSISPPAAIWHLTDSAHIPLYLCFEFLPYFILPCDIGLSSLFIDQAHLQHTEGNSTSILPRQYSMTIYTVLPYIEDHKYSPNDLKSRAMVLNLSNAEIL